MYLLKRKTNSKYRERNLLMEAELFPWWCCEWGMATARLFLLVNYSAAYRCVRCDAEFNLTPTYHLSQLNLVVEIIKGKYIMKNIQSAQMFFHHLSKNLLSINQILTSSLAGCESNPFPCPYSQSWPSWFWKCRLLTITLK